MIPSPMLFEGAARPAKFSALILAGPTLQWPFAPLPARQPHTMAGISGKALQELLLADTRGAHASSLVELEVSFVSQGTT